MLPIRPRTRLQSEFPPGGFDIPTNDTLGAENEVNDEEFMNQIAFFSTLSEIMDLEQTQEDEGLISPPRRRRRRPQPRRRVWDLMDPIAVEIVSDPADYVENAQLHLPFAPQPFRSYELEIAVVPGTQQPAGVWVESGSEENYSQVTRVYVAMIETRNRRLVGDLNFVRLRFLCREGALSPTDGHRLVEWMLAGSGGIVWMDWQFWDDGVAPADWIGPSPLSWNRRSMFVHELDHAGN